MTVPPEPSREVAAPHRLVPGDHVLDGAGEYVDVVGQARGKGRSVVEDELLTALGASELLVECELRPQREGEVLPLAHVVHGLSDGRGGDEGDWDSERRAQWG